MTEFCEKLTLFADGALSSAEAAAVRDHLATCARCQQELHDILQMQFLEERAARPATRSPQPALPARWPLRRVVAISALSLAAAMAVYLVLRPDPRRGAAIDFAQTSGERALEARLTHRGAAAYRRYNPPAGSVAPEASSRLLGQLTRLEEAQDWHGLGAAWLWLGQPSRALVYLQRAQASTDVESDHAVASLLAGDDNDAATRLEAVLGQNPGHPQALWNRALLARHLHLGLTAAADFATVAKQGEPGWSKEALERSEQQRADILRRHDSWLRMSAAAQALLRSAAPIPAELLAQFPDELRLHFYDAVRGAPSAQRVLALQPLAVALDKRFGGSELQEYVARIAQSSFAERAALAEIYRRLADPAASFSPTQIDEYLRTLRSSRQPDILLGALVQTDRVQANLEEYLSLAQATRDPWFALFAEQQRATREMAQGALLEAERQLRPAALACRTGPFRYRCGYLNFKLGELYRELNRTDLAYEAGRVALHLVQEIDAWQLETTVLALLGDIAFFDNHHALIQIYFREIAEREALGPEDCRFTKFMRDRLAMVEVFNLRFDAARQVMTEAGHCGVSPSKIGLFVQVDVARSGSANEIAAVRDRITAWRKSPQPGRDQGWWADFLEGRLLLRSESERGNQLLRTAIQAAERVGRWDEEARKVRAYSYQTLIGEAGRKGEYAQVLTELAKELEVPLPNTCVVGLALDGEQRVSVVRGMDGSLAGRFEVVQTWAPAPASPQLPSAALASLRGCSEIAVLAEAPFQGRPNLLPSELSWSYRLGGQDRSRGHKPARSLIVSDVEPPRSLDLPPLSAWQDGALAEGSLVTLTGPSATPTRTLAAMTEATDIVIHAHGLVNHGVSDASFLVLSQDTAGQYALTARQVQQAPLQGAPLVFLSACHAAVPGPMLYAPWSLPKAFIDAGASAVMAAATEIPSGDASLFFTRLRKRIAQGQAPASALRDERQAWLKKNPQSFVSDILLFQ